MIYYFLIIIAAIFTYMRIETSILKLSIVDFSTNSKGLKIAHISDIHINKLYISTNRIISNIDKCKPDIILLTGDYIQTEKDINKFITLLKQMTTRYPVYLCLGNHDHKAFRKGSNLSFYINELKQTGATVLINSSIKIKKGKNTYNIIGIDDLKYGNPDIQNSLKGLTSNDINIAISHNPDIALSLRDSGIDYLFCGHFHGGQIWMPFHLEFHLLRREKLCKQGYRRGLHKINGINVYINRGIGNVSLPFRLFSIPEIAIIQLP